jgi:hypothetical protein
VLSNNHLPSGRGELMTLAQNARHLVQSVIAVRDEIADAVAFFDQDNLERFARWADHHHFDHLSYSVKPGSVEVHGGGSDKARVLSRRSDLTL